MNYTPEQFAQAVLVALEQLNCADVSKLSLVEKREFAKNSNTPQETLITLAKDKDSCVRNAVENNPNSTREIIQTVRAHNFFLEYAKL